MPDFFNISIVICLLLLFFSHLSSQITATGFWAKLQLLLTARVFWCRHLWTKCRTNLIPQKLWCLKSLNSSSSSMWAELHTSQWKFLRKTGQKGHWWNTLQRRWVAGHVCWRTVHGEWKLRVLVYSNIINTLTA